MMLGADGIRRKSQIVIEYAYRYRDAYPEAHVFWVYAANAARFDQSYKNIARKLKLPRVDDPDVDVCELVSDWLNNNDDGEWLMILDNADNSDLFFSLTAVNPASERSATKKPLADYLPKRLTSKQSLLITTRNQQLGDDLSHGEEGIEVLPFSLREAAVLLRSKAGKSSDSWNDSDADQLAEMLGRIPLALTQAATFIKRNRMSPRRYQESLEANEDNVKEFLSIEYPDHRRERGIPNAVFRTWELSFNQILEQEPRASEILSLMAMFDRQQIPELLIRQQGRDADFFRAVGTLQSLSMVTKEAGKETYTIHRLVQLSVHVWLEGHSQKPDYQEKALSQLADRFPNGNHENRALCEMLLPHAQAVLRCEFDAKPSQLRLADLLYRISWFDWQQGRYDQAYVTGLKAHWLVDNLLGQDNIQTIEKLSMVALVLRDQGKYEEAETMNRRALEGREKALGKEHLSTLTSVSNLASVLQDQGKYEKAETMNRRALKGREKALGKEHPDTLTSVSNLALVLQYQGKYEEAETMNRRALEGKEKALGNEHPDTLTSVSNLAQVLQNQGKYEQAETMNRRALEGKEKALGNEHPDTLTSVSNLALVLQDQGKYEEAETMNRRALEGREKSLGKEHPSTLTSVNNLALVLQNQGKYAQAETMNRRALKGKEKALGNEHPSTLTSVSNLALVLQDQGKYEEAETMNRRALEGSEKSLGKEHPDTLTSVGNLAQVLQNQGKYEQAETMNRRALEGKEKALGNEHPDTLTSVSCLAYLYHRQKRYDIASELYQRACDGRKRVLGPEHPSTVACCDLYSRMVGERDQLTR
jgi:tetratricopeptide (TPR) repeat protein